MMSALRPICDFVVRKGYRIARALLLSTFLLACADKLPTVEKGTRTARGPLFLIVQNPVLDSAQRARVDTLLALPFTAELHLAEVAPAASDMLLHDRAIDLPVSPAVTVHAIVRDVHQDGDFLLWSGCLPNGACMVNLVLTQLGITGSANTGSAAYSMSPIGGGIEALVRTDQSKIPPD